MLSEAKPVSTFDGGLGLGDPDIDSESNKSLNKDKFNASLIEKMLESDHANTSITPSVFHLKQTSFNEKSLLVTSSDKIEDSNATAIIELAPKPPLRLKKKKKKP